MEYRETTEAMAARLSSTSHRRMKSRDDFAGLFRMLEQPVDRRAAHAGYAQLLTRLVSPSFRRETLKLLD